MVTEIELKYSLDDARARALLQERRLAGNILTPFVTKTVDDVYYDTPDSRVAQAGYALRIRRKGDETALQLKSLTPAAGAWHRRRELHIPSADPQHPDRWPHTPEARFLRKVIGGRPLQPLFNVHQQRHEAQVLDESGAPFGLLSLDQVRWEAHGRSKEAWEMEIELLPGGDEARLRALADALQKMTGLHPQTISKYEQGLALL
jgi:inorganic triphosphatase YgiF